MAQRQSDLAGADGAHAVGKDVAAKGKHGAQQHHAAHQIDAGQVCRRNLVVQHDLHERRDHQLCNGSHQLDEDGEEIDIKNGFDNDEYDVIPAADTEIEFENINDATYDNGFVLDNEDGAEVDEDDDSDFYNEQSFGFDDDDFDSMDDEENY